MTVLELIRASQLVSEETLEESMKRISGTGCLPDGIAVLKDLVAQGVLSQWQADIIGKHGRFKGFIQGRYIIVRGHRQSASVTIAEACDRKSGQYALLRVPRFGEAEYLMPLSVDENGGFPIVSRDARLSRSQ